jgi:hypothetical protein
LATSRARSHRRLAIRSRARSQPASASLRPCDFQKKRRFVLGEGLSLQAKQRSAPPKKPRACLSQAPTKRGVCASLKEAIFLPFLGSVGVGVCVGQHPPACCSSRLSVLFLRLLQKTNGAQCQQLPLAVLLASWSSVTTKHSWACLYVPRAGRALLAGEGRFSFLTSKIPCCQLPQLTPDPTR